MASPSITSSQRASLAAGVNDNYDIVRHELHTLLEAQGHQHARAYRQGLIPNAAMMFEKVDQMMIPCDVVDEALRNVGQKQLTELADAVFGSKDLSA
jgi:hypothetical protein